MKIEVNGREKNNDVFCWIAYEGAAERKQKMTIEDGYSCVVHINGEFYGEYRNPNTYTMDTERGANIIVYAFEQNLISCLFGVGEQENILNAFGEYKVKIDMPRVFLRYLGRGKRQYGIRDLRDYINPELPSALRSCKTIVEAEQQLTKIIKGKLRDLGVELISCEFEEINFK